MSSFEKLDSPSERIAKGIGIKRMNKKIKLDLQVFMSWGDEKVVAESGNILGIPHRQRPFACLRPWEKTLCDCSPV